LTDDAGPVFLTGATGFIGGRLAETLHARGRRLRCLVRDPRKSSGLARLGAELVPGDITDGTALDRGLEGADLAYHLAAIYDVGVVDRAALERTNVEGTRTVLQAATRAGTRRVVHVSTTAALSPARASGEQPRAWSGPFPSVYHGTKARAHQLAAAAQAAGQPVIIVCPAFVYGPGDQGPGGRFLKDVLGGRLPALMRDPAWFSFVHVDDVASALVAAGERGRTGATYVLGGEAATINDFAELAAEYANVRVPRLRIPTVLGLLAGGVCDAASQLSRRRFPMSREGVRTVTGDRWLHSDELAVRELDWRPRPLSAGLPATVTQVLREIS